MGRSAAPTRIQFWRTVPASSLVLFYAGVFWLFAVLGFLTLIDDTSRLNWQQASLNVLLSGGTAVLFAITAIRQKYLLMPLIALVTLPAFRWLAREIHKNPSVADIASLESQVKYLVFGGSFALAAAYTFFLVFFSREGTRYFRAHAEIALARELHQALVPVIQRTIGDFEIYGDSLPSGEVGGDLVDLVENADGWTAYVADVSGHGVSPGVLMAMMKASVRSRILAGSDGESLLQGVHETLYPLKTANMFITAGLLEARNGRLRLSLAGHPALLHFQAQTAQVCEYPSMDLPLGILPEQTFGIREIECRPDDILLLLTDGITEVSNREGEELGAEPIKSALQRGPKLPLPELFQQIRQLSLDFGKQQDDQTMLLVRRRG